MALTIDEVTSSAKSADADIAAGEKGASQAAASAFSDELARQGANTGATNPALHHDNAAPAPQTKPSDAPPPARATCTTVAKPGDTFWGLAQKYHTTPKALEHLNPHTKPRQIQIGQTINLPSKACQPQSSAQTAPAKGKPPATQKTLSALDKAVQQAGNAQSSLDKAASLAAKGDGAARAQLRDGSLQQGVSTSNAKINAAVNNEITAKVGANATDAQVAKAGQDIVAGYAKDPEASKLVSNAVTQVRADRQVQAIVSKAQTQTDPVKALRALNDGYKAAPQTVKDAILSDPNAQKIISNAASWANQPLTQKSNGAIFPQAQTNAAIQRLDGVTQGLDKTLAGAVSDQAVSGYEQFAKSNQNTIGGSPLGSMGMTTLVNLSGRIAGTPQGDDAVSRFAATGAWNTDSVRNAIGAGADPAYAIAFGRQMKAAGQDPSIVVQTINEGVAMSDEQKIANGGDINPTLGVAKRMQAAGLDASGVVQVAADGAQGFKNKVASDVQNLAKHDAELAWLVKNDGAGMSPQQLNQAVSSYIKSKGASWQKQDAQFRQQISDDGAKLLNQMVALNQAPPTSSGVSGKILRTIANDPSANLAISSALQSNPNLVNTKTISDLGDVFSLSKIGDIGRKYTNELASAFLRSTVLDKIQGVDLANPQSVAQAKQAISDLNNGTFARLLGVAPSDLNKALKEVQETADRVASAPQDANAALQDLNKKLNNDVQLSKTFNKTTLPGQLLRGVGVAFAGVSLINSYNKFNANPSDPQNGIKLAVDAAGFAQKNSELLVGLGMVNKDSALGQFGGEWKLAGRASAGDLISGISAVLDGISAVRSGFGLGVPQDTGNAIFSATTAVGGGLTVAPAFGAAAWMGPVGLGVTAAGVVGKMIYQSEKDAHMYQGASQNFLKAAGYGNAAASALSGQDGIFSGAAGSAQMPFLAKYAQYKNLSTSQLQQWVNSLTPDQVNNLAKCLQQTAGDSKGDPAQFTNGPAQTAVIPDYTGGWASIITLANTVGVFDSNLNYSHVPHP